MQTLKTGLAGAFIYQGIKPGAEKISFSLGKPGVHYTGIIHGTSRIFDFHKTYDPAGSAARHERLFEMSVFKLLRKLSRISEAVQPLIFEFLVRERLNLGKIMRNGSFLLPMDHPQDLAGEFGKMRPNGRYFRFRSEVPVSVVEGIIVYPEDLDCFPPGGYLLYRWKRGRLSYDGFLFRHKNDLRNRSMYFISRKRWREFTSQLRAVAEREFALE